MRQVRWEVTLDHAGNAITVSRLVYEADEVLEHLTVDPGPFEPLGLAATEAAVALHANWVLGQLPLWEFPATAP